MPSVKIEAPYYPIIYVRGYAGTQGAVESTVATPYMGFNLGSTKVRQRWDRSIDRLIFESPLVRLMKDHGYIDAYAHGQEIPPDVRVPARSVFIHRYYEPVSEALGTGERPSIEVYARGLDGLVSRVREQVCGDDAGALAKFKVYLVAHSMGGLICRTFLQNSTVGSAANRRAVDKVFTYATPHNGIDLRLVGNVPGWLPNNARNFDRDVMKKYLKVSSKKLVNTLNGEFPENRFFSMVGTNAKDYDVPGSARAVGDSSDGLVRIENATVRGTPRAFAYRSHSGDYGIVNSEEGYQNLQRFLFGDVRIDGQLHVTDISLPAKVEKKRLEGRKIRASYHFESLVNVRGARAWDLSRRLTGEHSAIFRDYDELMHDDSGKHRMPRMFSVYLSEKARIGNQRSLAFSTQLRVLVPDYEVDGFLFLDDHFEGGTIFDDRLIVQLRRGDANQAWKLRYGWNSSTPGRATRSVDPVAQDGALLFDVPVETRRDPGIEATLRLTVGDWS